MKLCACAAHLVADQLKREKRIKFYLQCCLHNNRHNNIYMVFSHLISFSAQTDRPKNKKVNEKKRNDALALTTNYLSVKWRYGMHRNRAVVYRGFPFKNK